MTTFAGQFSGSLVDVEADAVSTNLASDDGVQVFDAFQQAGISDSDALTDNLPISMPAVTSSGHVGKSGAGNTDWYYRFHIIPTEIDVGNVLNDSLTSFVVWNAWPTAKTLVSIDESGDSTGLTVSPPSPYTVPYSIPGLEDQTFMLGVEVAGPSLIDMTYTFNFSSGEGIDVAVSGQRIFAWTFRPHWGSDIEERLEWATDILTAYDGTEQRIALRASPRRMLAYQFMIDNNSDRRKFEAMLFNWGARVWMVPFWMEGNVFYSGLASGSTSFSIDRVSGNWQEGGHALIMTEAFTFEIVKIDSIVGNLINLNGPTTMTWPAGTVVYPAVTGLLSDKQELNRFTRNTEYGMCAFKLFETETVAADSPTTYRGLPVITQAPHWQQDITHDFLRKLQEIDFRLGKFSFEDEAGMPFNIINHHWVADGKDEIDALREFIYSQCGKQKTVWLPTFTPDIELVADANSASVYLDVAHGYLVKHLWGHINRRDIRIELVDGTVLYRRITDIDEMSATVERLTINSALGVDITPETVDRISWMSVARFDTDSISLLWKHDDWAECAVNWRTVRDDV